MIRHYLVPVVLMIAGAAASAQPPGAPPQGSQPVVAKPNDSTQPIAPRQLSAQELAELRKLLTQNSRHPAKGS